MRAAKASKAQLWRHRSRTVLNHRQAGLENAERSFEQAARNQTEMEVARATARTQAVVIAYLLRIEHIADNQVSIQLMQLFYQINAVEENALVNQKMYDHI